AAVTPDAAVRHLDIAGGPVVRVGAGRLRRAPLLDHTWAGRGRGPCRYGTSAALLWGICRLLVRLPQYCGGGDVAAMVPRCALACTLPAGSGPFPAHACGQGEHRAMARSGDGRSGNGT